MPNYTTHYNLIEQLGGEHPSISKINDNFRVIDAELYKNSVLTGASAPTTSTAGAVGQFYLDIAVKKLYQCMTQGPVYTWEPVSEAIKLLQSYTVAGSYTFIVPTGITKLYVLMIGAGGAGARCCDIPNKDTYFPVGYGGGSGYVDAVFLDVVKGQTLNGVVGAGGSSNGGSTSFNGVAVAGGSCGINPHYTSYGAGTPGGQYADSILGMTPLQPPYGMKQVLYNDGSTSGSSGYKNSPVPDAFLISKLAHFPEFRDGKLFHICAGGNACFSTTANGGQRGQLGITFSNGKTSSTASGAGSATRGTDPGCGGSAGLNDDSGRYGADGAVYIYGR